MDARDSVEVVCWMTRVSIFLDDIIAFGRIFNLNFFLEKKKFLFAQLLGILQIVFFISYLKEWLKIGWARTDQ